jgi:UDP-N-acetylmuramoyl-tripeptide--D-alanyl-D-alanine ligase
VNTGTALLAGLVLSLPWSIWYGGRMRRALQVLQQEEYDNARTLRWARHNWAYDYAPLSYLAALVITLAFTSAVLEHADTITVVCAVLFVLLGAGTTLTTRQRGDKKRLVLTARVKRLIVALTVVVLALGGLMVLGGWILELDGRDALVVVPLLAWLGIVGGPQLSVAANILAWPVEETNRRRYRREAVARLHAVAPRIVAITGSYGKTTTKELTAAVLEARYRVARTPSSFNTVMGITRAIREQLKDGDEVFVVEMGAYQHGDIGDLCRFVGGPDLSAIVGINEQHLERMGTIENTIRAKYEIVQGTKPGGVSIFNVDNAYCAKLADQTTHVRVVRIGSGEAARNADLYADNVMINPKVMRFDVHAGDETVTVRTRLVGRHLLPNILIALAFGRELGVDLRTAASRIGRVEPVDHRLKISEVDGRLLIDDAYSSNVDGARAALALLAELPAQRRIAVTPGIVELGHMEERRNRELGEQAAAVCDILIGVGARPGRYVREGAMAAGMSSDRVVTASSLADAQGWLREHSQSGDAILFENDLPDLYV